MIYKGKTITKHQRGNWFARVRHNGKSISIYGRTQLEAYEKLKMFVDKIEEQKILRNAQKLLAKLESLNTQNFFQIQKTVEHITTKEIKQEYTLKEWFEEWLSSYKVGNVRVATVHSFKSRFIHLQKLYDVKLSEITNLMLSRAINEIVSVRVKDGVHNLLKQMFAVAFNNRFIEINPAASLPRPKQFALKQQKALTQEQETKLIEKCLTDLEQYEPFIICALQGLRKGEMLALKPNDFDFEKNTLRVDESYSESFPDDMQTKNKDSNRIMPMFNLTRQVLLKYANADPNERIYTHSSLILSKRLDSLTKQIDLPRITIHELRHTFVSRCHEKGIDELIVQKWIGHAKGSVMTKAVYTHVADDAEKKYIDILNNKNN